MNALPQNEPRLLLGALYEAALAGVEPSRAVAQALARPAIAQALQSARRVGIFAIGKAAALMFEAAPAGDAALVVLPRGYPPPRRRDAEVRFASHPAPDRSSVGVARQALSFFKSFSAGDVLLCLVSGGASSLLCMPRPGLTLPRKRAIVTRAIQSGASIVEVNRLRRRLSAVKGGRLGRVTRARLVTLVLSDVPGDDPQIVGSGPTVRARRGDIVKVVASNRLGLASAAGRARGLGIRVRLFGRRLEGEARAAGFLFARAARRLPPGMALLAGGETTVALSPRPGRGGRNLEFALGWAREIEGEPRIALLAAGSDGIDGSSRGAGAFADGGTILRACELGLDPQLALDRHDTERFFARLGDLFVTGPTGTNVGDWVFVLRAQSEAGL